MIINTTKKIKKERQGLCFLYAVEEHWAEGAVFLQPSIRCNYKWPRAEGWGSQSDLGSHVNLRPTVSWLWQQDFTSIIQIPKQRQSALCQLRAPGPCLQAAHGGKRQRKKDSEPSRTDPAMNENPQVETINRGHNHTLIRVNTLSGWNCCHSPDSETHLYSGLQRLFNRHSALFLNDYANII